MTSAKGKGDFMINFKKVISTYIKKEVIKYLNDKEIKNLNKIGEGGAGFVYSGECEKKKIAIKFLSENSTSKISRFIAEYKNVSQLKDNRYIIKMLDYKEVSYTFENEQFTIRYIVMDYHNSTLFNLRKEYVSKKNIEKNDVLELFKFLINSLNYIHNNQIYHRDIKPENILVTKSGKYKLADFGISFFHPDKYSQIHKTLKNERLANAQFSAPEQSEKEDSSVADARMDIYALGQIIQWYITGKVHKGSRRKSIRSYFKPSNEIEVIDKIVDRCLENTPSHRFNSIDAIKKYYKEYFEHISVPEYKLNILKEKHVPFTMKNIELVDDRIIGIIFFLDKNGIILHMGESKVSIKKRLLHYIKREVFTSYNRIIYNEMIKYFIIYPRKNYNEITKSKKQLNIIYRDVLLRV